ncbi:CopD family protein [Aliisedimentitalea scapharcae]|uniref:CopD family protein n=1 Tax=Aliisedimentitalea scapharcae TaxID=1524259 RepID=A0ABZ2XT95_9RHOB
MAAIMAKLALYIGVTGALGLVLIGAVFAGSVAPIRNRMRMQAGGLAALALVAAMAGFMLRGAALTGGAGGMIDPEMLGLLWSTPVGDALAYRIAGSLLMLGGLFVPHVGMWIALAGGGLALWSFTQIGHVPDAGQLGIRLTLFAHLLGVSFWFGVLGPLHHLCRHHDHLERAARLGHLFGQVASVVVPVLFLAGLWMAWRVLGDLSMLITSGYGLTLLIKLALVGVVLAFAAANKLRLVPAMLAAQPKAADRMARSVQIETGVILAILATTATLTSVLTLPT